VPFADALTADHPCPREQSMCFISDLSDTNPSVAGGSSYRRFSSPRDGADLRTVSSALSFSARAVDGDTWPHDTLECNAERGA